MSMDKDLEFLSRIQDEWLREFCEEHRITYYSPYKEYDEEQKQEIIILDFNLN